MARIRTIKPEFWTSEQVVECSTNARLLFIGLWNFCDDRGVHPASVKRIKMEVFPGDIFPLEEVEAWIKELLSAKLLYLFHDDNDPFWYVSGWKHQKIDKPSYKYPIPPLFDEYSANDSGTIVEHSPPEGKGREGKKKNTKRENPKTPTLEEVEKYFESKGYSLQAAKKAWEYYDAANWIDSKGNPVLAWKQKMVGVWFKEENKAPIKITKEISIQIDEAMRGDREWTSELKELKEIYLNQKYG